MKYFSFKILNNLQFLYLILFINIFTEAKAQIDIHKNSYGLPGLIDMPIAGVFNDGEVSFTSSKIGPNLRNTIGFQALPRVFATFRYSGIGDKQIGWKQKSGYAIWDRSFDLRVPEEINRKIVDHLSDVNLTYSQISKANLLRENIDPDRVIFIGSPLKEVFQFYKKKINKSKILSALKIKKFNYFLISFHREENIDSEDNFKDFIKLLSFLKSEFKIPIVVSTHFRLNQKLKNTIIKNKLTDIIFMKPFSYSDYCKLQLNSKMIFSDSGSLTEETSIMRLKSINIRDSQERHEGFEDGIVPLTGLNLKLIKNAIYYLLSNKNKITPVSDYERGINISSKLVTIIISFVDQINKKSWFKK